MPNYLFVFLLIMTVVRIGLAMLFPITADESYYWLWTRHLSLSYVEHPPMVAWLNFIATWSKANLFSLRVLSALIALCVSVILFYTAKKLFSEKTAVVSVILFQILPHFLIIWLTMFVDLPLVLFWTIALYLLAKIIDKEPPHAAWYWLGIVVGLGSLSKYTMFLFWPCLLLFFALSPKQRFWLKRKEPYFTLLISLLLFSPVIFWNLQHNFSSFIFHSQRVAGNAWGTNFIPFVVDQLVHFTPFLICMLPAVANFSLKKNDSSRLLLAFSILPLLIFLMLSLKIKVWAHWPSFGYIALLPLSADYLIEKSKKVILFIKGIAIFSLLILIILLFISPGVVLHQKEYAKNYLLKSRLPSGDKIFAQTNVSASLAEFYSGRQTFLTSSFLSPGTKWGLKQYQIWGLPELRKGESIVYYGEETPEMMRTAGKYFHSVSTLEARLYLIEDYINRYKFFRFNDYQLNGGQP